MHLLNPLVLLRNAALIIFQFKKNILNISKIHWAITATDCNQSRLELKSIVSILIHFDFIFDLESRKFTGFNNKSLNKVVLLDEPYMYENLTKYVNSKAVRDKVNAFWYINNASSAGVNNNE